MDAYYTTLLHHFCAPPMQIYFAESYVFIQRKLQHLSSWLNKYATVWLCCHVFNNPLFRDIHFVYLCYYFLSFKCRELS